ncbi:hypothetical protein [Nocardia amamiensis]|nr:hypothetical protein [Nocardia amamiensis]
MVEGRAPEHHRITMHPLVCPDYERLRELIGRESREIGLMMAIA